MSDEIYFDGKRYVSASEASHSSGLSRDYISRLCRDGKMRGRRVGKNWYVGQDSLNDFLITQEHTKAVWRDSLAEKRKQEYTGVRNKTGAPAPRHVPVTRVEEPMPRVQSSPVAAAMPAVTHAYQKLSSAVAQQSARAFEKTADVVTAPSGIADAALRTVHVPVYAVTPALEFVHKLTALTLAVMLTFGTYALVDPAAADIVSDTIDKTARSVGGAYHDFFNGGADRFATNVQSQVAAVAEHPGDALAAAVQTVGSAIPNALESLARTVNAGVNDFVYSIAFPQSLVSSGTGVVTVEIQPYARATSTGTGTGGSTIAYGGSVGASAAQPIVHTVEVQRIIEAGGITEAELADKLNQLSNKLVSQMYTLSSAPNTLPATGGYNNNIAITNRIDRLDSVSITGSTWSGGTISNTSITGSSVAATTLSASQGAELATTTVTGSLTVTSDSATTYPLVVNDNNGSTVFSVYNDGTLTTNIASSTSSYSQLLITGSATATTLYATNLIVSNLSSSTNILASNSTTTNLTATNITSFFAPIAPYFIATSTTASVFPNASTTVFSNFGTAYFGGTSTTTISSTGAVGVASTTPWGLLSVNPNALGSGVPEFVVGSSTATHFLINGAGNVGIGTTTPTDKLAVNSSVATQLGVYTTDQTGSYSPRLFIGNQYGPTQGTEIVWDNFNGDTSFNNHFTSGPTAFQFQKGAFGSGTSLLTIQNSGNVGVSSSTPWGMMSINPSALGSGVPEFVVGSSTATHFVVTGDGDVGVGTASPASPAGATRTFNISDTAAGQKVSLSLDSVGGNWELLNNAQGLFQFVKSGSIKATLDTSGNFGIGTTSPWALLSINPNGISGPAFAIGSSTATSFVVNNGAGGSALVGINGQPFSSSYSLNVVPNGNSTGGIVVGQSASVFQATLGREPSTSNGLFQLYPGNTTASVYLNGGASKNSYFNTGGNFGIGTTSPFASLSVVGGASGAGTLIGADAISGFSGDLLNLRVASSSVFSVNQAGNLTLGTALAQGSGGTGQTSYTAGDILYANGSGNLAKLGIGAAGNVLTVAAGLPAWGTAGASGPGVTGAWATTTNNQILYPSTTSWIVLAGANATSSNNSIFEVHGQSYFSSNVGIATTSPSAELSVEGNAYVNGGVGVGVFNTTSGTLQTSGTATFGGAVTLSSVTGSSLLYANASKAVSSVTLDSSLSLSGANFSLNMANANSWTALQSFALASTSQLSVFNKAYFGGTATSTFDTTGFLTLPSGFLSQASSTIGDGSRAGGLTISGGATTTGDAYFAGGVGIASSTPGAQLSISVNSTVPALLVDDGLGGTFLTITSGGKTGIGTTTPWARLSVVDQNNGTPPFVVADKSSVPELIVDTSGRVGIATSTPNWKLVSLNASGPQFALSDGSGNQWTLRSAGGFLYFATSTYAATSSDAWLTLGSNGNIGIGTTTPLQNRLTIDQFDAVGVTRGAAIGAFKSDLTNGGIVDLFQFGKGVAAGESVSQRFTYGTASDSKTSWFFPGGSLLATLTQGGNFGVGTTSPYTTLSVTNTASNAQASIAYDATRYTELQTDASGDFVINPSGSDAFLNDDNLWVCTGGSCPSGSPSGTGNLIVETKLGIGTSTPDQSVVIFGDGASLELAQSTNASFTNITGNDSAGILGSVQFIGTNFATAARQSDVEIDSYNSGDVVLQGISGGNVGIGTTTPSAQLATAGLIFVGASGATTLGTATSTFYGDIKIAGKLDVGTIDPPYTIDGVKYATYGHATVGVKEEAVSTVKLAKQDASGRYAYTIDFPKTEQGSDFWLFYQVTDFGKTWDNLVVSLTPSFDGSVYYEKHPENGTLTLYADQPGEVSLRLIANRYDFSKWNNLRPDQDGDTTGTHVISSK